MRWTITAVAVAAAVAAAVQGSLLINKTCMRKAIVSRETMIFRQRKVGKRHRPHFRI